MAVDEIADRLYGLPPTEFTRARDEAARELRDAGRRQEAELVKALRKPTAAAAAVNQLVRGHRREVDAWLRAAAKLRDAQVGGRGDPAPAARAEREALATLVALGGEIVRPTLRAAAVDDDVAQELLQARLQREPEPRGLGTLVDHARPAAAGASDRPTGQRKAAHMESPRKRTAPKRPKPDDGAARTRLREARELLAAAAAEERRARRRWAESQRELEGARKEVERAQRDLDRLRRPPQ